MQSNDQDLLRAFSHEGSQEAFATLAQRYAGLLYHAALRLTACPDLAQEAAQNALAILARKAASLHAVPSLAAWLHRTVCFEASKLRRRERRHNDRMKRLQDSTLAATPSVSPEPLHSLLPDLDEALNELAEPDRQVVLLKYFDGLTFEEMAQQLGGQAAAWRQRGSRALNRLRDRLARRGVVVPLAVLTAGLKASVSEAAPPLVMASLTTTPLTIAASLPWRTLALHTFHLMNAKQTTLTVAVVLAALIPLGYQATVVYRSQSQVAALETTASALRFAAGLDGPPSIALARSGQGEAAVASVKKNIPPSGGIDLLEMAQLLAEGRNADTVKVLKYRTLLMGLDAAALDGLLSAGETLDLPPHHRRALYEQLLSLLADKDPALATATGMRLVAGMAGDEATRLWMNPLPNALREWAQKDPAAARAWYEQNKASEAFQNKALGDADLAGWMAGGVFTGMMWGGERAGGLAFFQTLDESAMSVALQRFGTSNPNAADHAEILRLASAIKQPSARTNALVGATNTLGGSDLAQAGAFIAQAGLPSAETRKLLVAAAVAPLNRSNDINVPERLTWLRGATPPDQQEKALGYFLGATAFTDTAAIRKTVDAELSAGASDVFLGAFIRDAARRSNTMEIAAAYLPRLTDPAERTRTLREIQENQPDAGRDAALKAGIPVADLDAALQPK